MKNTAHSLLLAALMLTGTAFSTFAQEEKDTTNIRIGDMKVIMIDEGDDDDSLDVTFDDDDDNRLELTHFGGIDMGFNMLLNADGKIGVDTADSWLELDYGRSMSWRVNLFEEKIRLYKDYIGILIGAGFTYNSYGLKNNVDVATSDSLGTFGVERNTEDVDYSKNKLRASYINVPVMLEINTSEEPEKSFHFAAGVTGGWRMGAVTKQKFENDDEEIRLRRKSDFNLSDWTLDASVRVGYSDITVWANYGLTPLFQKDKGPEVYPLSVGIQFLPF
jgi:Outer membrane protein beta-barrel domain